MKPESDAPRTPDTPEDPATRSERLQRTMVELTDFALQLVGLGLAAWTLALCI